jgi:hypothetical protein
MVRNSRCHVRSQLSLPTSGECRGPAWRRAPSLFCKGTIVNNIIYIIGLVVVIIAILSFFGLR